jgi:hypothetical protein
LNDQAEMAIATDATDRACDPITLEIVRGASRRRRRRSGTGRRSATAAANRLGPLAAELRRALVEIPG